MLAAAGLQTTFRGRMAGQRRRSTASTWRSAAARSSPWSASPAAARPRWPGPCSAWSGRARGQVLCRRRARSATTAAALKAYRRQVQLVLQDPTGSLNPRHTVYEAVAEGLRVHRVAGRRARPAGRRRPVAGPGCDRRSGSSCATRTSCPAASGSGSSSPVRWSLEPEVLVADEPVSSPRRLGARRDPGAAAQAARRARPVGARGHPRPRPGLEHRRPDRGDVPRPDRRGRPDRGGARRRRSTPTPGRCCRSSPRSSTSSRSCCSGETAGPHPDPARLPLPPALPGSSRPARPSGPASLDRCRGEALPVLPARQEHAAACFLSGLPSGMLAR